jgi:hypothetical protein
VDCCNVLNDWRISGIMGVISIISCWLGISAILLVGLIQPTEIYWKIMFPLYMIFGFGGFGLL